MNNLEEDTKTITMTAGDMHNEAQIYNKLLRENTTTVIVIEPIDSARLKNMDDKVILQSATYMLDDSQVHYDVMEQSAEHSEVLLDKDNDLVIDEIKEEMGLMIKPEVPYLVDTNKETNQQKSDECIGKMTFNNTIMDSYTANPQVVPLWKDFRCALANLHNNRRDFFNYYIYSKL